MDRDLEACIQRKEESYKECQKSNSIVRFSQGYGDSKPTSSEEMFSYLGEYKVVIYENGTEITRTPFHAKVGGNYEFLFQSGGSLNLMVSLNYFTFVTVIIL